MIDVSNWISNYLQALTHTFGGRICFVGLQGSHARGEATETSDVDVVVILDELSAADIQAYNGMLDGLPQRELACGFLSGRQELLNWEASDLFQFYYDTTPIIGSLDELLTRIDAAAVDHAIKAGACSIYHGCVHNMLYEKSEDLLRSLYKSASFIIQAICFRESGRYIRRLNELLSAASPEDCIIVHTFQNMKEGGKVEFQEMSERLFAWSQAWIAKTE